MKVLFHLSHYPGVGGINTVTDTIASWMIERGDEVHVSAHISSPESVPLNHSKFKWFTVPDAGKYDTRTNRKYVARLLADGHYDLVVYQDSYAPTEKVIVEAAQASGTPLVVCEHNSPDFVRNKRTLAPIYTPKGFLRRALHPGLLWRDARRKRYLFDHCQKYVLLSQSFIPEFSRVTGIDGSHPKLAFISNPYPFAPVVPDLSAKENTILFVGRLCAEKRVGRLLEIWRSMQDELPDWRFRIIGDGPEKRSLLRKAEYIGAERVEFTGFRDPKEDYLKSKILLLASKMEGFGIVLIEAMAAGCVPVSLDSFASLRDIIQPGENGCIVSSDRTEEWRRVLLGLVRSSSQVETMATEAVASVSRFSKEKIEPQWRRLFASVLESTMNSR